MGYRTINSGVVPISVFLFLGAISYTSVIATPPLQLSEQVGLLYDSNEAFAVTRNTRLPRAVVPINYKLEIRPILDVPSPDNFTAPGKVRIHVKCLQSTNFIELHSDDIEIQTNNVTVSSVAGSSVSVIGHAFNTTKLTYLIYLGSNLLVNEEYNVEVPFIAKVAGNRLSGLYRSSYISDITTGERRWIATTQFQKLGARQAFPCFDEPALKATFDVKIGRNDDDRYHSLFCTEMIGAPQPIEGLTGWVWDEYNTTLVMSTYLLAIIVSDFNYELASPELYRLPVRTWGPPPMMAQEDSAKFSAEAAAKIIDFFEKYYDYPYELTKMDSVAIPDFAAGAMENWGLNTYRIELMLFFKGDSTQFEQWRQAAVISHELCHQWFGNLVTNDWWNDLWLNEGFARYMQFVGVNTTFPELESMNRVVLDTIQLAMDYDASRLSVPVHSEVTEVVINMPSRIAYEKAGSLIRMMNGFLTEATLIKGLRAYLRNHLYETAVQDDLFAALQTAALADGTTPPGLTVKDVMDTWTLQTGFPLIKIIRVSADRIYISQESFLTSENGDMNPNGMWHIPLTYATQSNPDFSEANWRPKLWLNKDTLLTQIQIPTTEWIIVNPDVRSYYRVLYDDHFTGLIKQQLDTDHTVISPSTRSQLFDDYFKMALSLYIPITKALDFTTYLDKEDTLVVWTTLFNNLRKSLTLLTETELYPSFKNYLLSKIEAPLLTIDVIQVEDEPPITSMLRAQLLDWACALGHSLCYTTATREMQKWIDDPENNPIAADIQPMLYCGAIANATGTAVKDFLISQRAIVGKSARQRTLMLNALACSNDAEELTRLLTSAIDSTSPLYGVALMQRIAENSIGRNLTLQFLKYNKTNIIGSLGATGISTVVSTISNYWSSSDHISTIQDFINDNSDLELPIQDSLTASLNNVRSNNEWRNTHYSNIQGWLDRQNAVSTDE